jgi:hypothetical protein
VAYRRLVTLAGLLATSCGIAACGSSDGSGTRTATDESAVAEAPAPPTCGRFCRQAGGFGDGGELEEMPVTIPAQEIAVTEGIAKVRATCNLDEDCVGAILISGSHVPEYGRADLAIPAGTEATVPIAVSPEGLEALEKSGDDPEAVVTVPLTDESQPLSFSEFLTIMAP